MVFERIAGHLLLGLAGLVLLILLSNYVIKKSLQLIARFGLSQTFIGLTVLSIGTSFPEFATNVIAGIEILRGQYDPFVLSSTALGTAIGSDNIQITLVVGLVALLATLSASKTFLRRDYLPMIGVSILVLLFSLDFFLSQWEALALIIGYVVYLWWVWRRERAERKISPAAAALVPPSRSPWSDSLLLLFGLGGLLLAAELVFRSTIFFVDQFHLSGSLIGVAIIGVATALPELTTSLAAARKKATKISLGILVGSNTVNMSLGVGFGAIFAGYQVSRTILSYDLISRLVLPLIVLVLFWKGTVGKREAIFLIALYVAYVILRLVFFPVDY